MYSLSNISIVLQQTYDPGNIGATARAMKNMGLDNLRLVNPVDFPADKATARAGQATDLLTNAQVFESLVDAVSDCVLVLGATARRRDLQLPVYDARQAASRTQEAMVDGRVAIVFGRERMGLHNKDLIHCNGIIEITANPAYPVLNIGQAVQVITYELHMLYTGMQASQSDSVVMSEQDIAPSAQVESISTKVEQMLLNNQYFADGANTGTMDLLRTFLHRARPTRKEVNLIHAVLQGLAVKK